MRLCKLVDFYQRFGGTAASVFGSELHLRGRKMLCVGKGGQCRGLEDCILCCRLVATFCSETNAYKLAPFRHTMWGTSVVQYR